MSNDNRHGLTPTNVSASPFDRIRRLDEFGEYWLARELMPLLGYRKWERFADAVDRARTSITATGMDPDQHVSRRREAFGRTKQMGDDFRLTRHGAHMVAMNGDVRKPEIAAAQTYFSAKTHEAELMAAATEFELPRTFSEALRLAADQQDEIDRLKLRNEQLTVKAESFDAWIDGDAVYLVGTVAKMLKIGPKALWDFLYEERILINAPKTKRHREPYAGKPSEKWFKVEPVDPKNANGQKVQTTYVLPYGAEQLRLLLIRRGVLPSEQLALLPGL